MLALLNREISERARSAELRATSNTHGLARYRGRPVEFCEEVLHDNLTDEVKDLLRAVVANTTTVAPSANSTGKTHAMARAAIYFFLCYDTSQVYTAAAPPERNLKTLLWGEIESVVEAHRELFAGMQVSLSSMLIKRPGKRSFIMGVSIPVTGTPAMREARFSGKHAPYMLFILDEGDAIPDEVYKGIESCMSGGECHEVVCLNPRAKAGPPYQMEQDGKARIVRLSAFGHPNVITGQDIIPGAVSRDITVRRINEWTRPLMVGEVPDGQVFEVPEFLVGAIALDRKGDPYPPLPPGMRVVSTPAFSYMVLGVYPAQSENQLISEQWISEARSRWDLYTAQWGERPPYGVPCLTGQDVGELGVDRSVLYPRWGSYTASCKWWSGADPLETAANAHRYCREWDASDIFVDSNGVGAGVVPEFRRISDRARTGIRAHRIMTAASPTQESELGQFNILRDQLWWAAREWLRIPENGAMLPPDERLIQELMVATYTTTKKGKISILAKPVMRELLKRSCDNADAFVLTFADPVDQPGEAGVMQYQRPATHRPKRRE